MTKLTTFQLWEQLSAAVRGVPIPEYDAPRDLGTLTSIVSDEKDGSLTLVFKTEV